MAILNGTYANPLTDYGFKKIFGEEPNKDILIEFLNDILPGERRVEDLQYLKNEKLGISSSDRKAIFDLYCTSDTGEKFIVELQKAKQNFFKDRSIYYSSFPIREQALKGDWDFRLEAVYTIGILDFIFDDHKNQEEYYHVIELKNQRNEVFYDKLKYVYVELPKFRNTADELSTRREKWLYVFRHLARLNERPQPLKGKIFEKLFEVAKISNFSPEEQDEYEESLKVYRDIKNVVDTSREEGMEEGIEKGIEQGIEEGIELVARNMLAMKISFDVIITATGLTEDQLKKLAED